MHSLAENYQIVITAAKRSAIGAFQGSLSSLASHQLAGQVIANLLADTHFSPNSSIQGYMGCVLQAGQGQNPARQALMAAKLSENVPAVTVNKVCGSGLMAVMMGCDVLRLGHAEIVIAGGQESMSQAPYLLPATIRSGIKFGHQSMKDHMLLDGLEDAYQPGISMGKLAEACAQKYHLQREHQDEFARQSLQKALQAIDSGAFNAEIAPVSYVNKQGVVKFDRDENPKAEKLAKIATLKPAFISDGTITAASSSALADGAAALLLMCAEKAKALDYVPLAKIVAYAAYAHQPEWFSTAPIGAIELVLKKANWQVDDVDLWEINEAFACVPMAAIEALAIAPESVNIHGGACALGHPIGASGARLLVTLIHALRQKKLKRGIVSLCIGGGEAVAMAIECSIV